MLKLHENKSARRITWTAGSLAGAALVALAAAGCGPASATTNGASATKVFTVCTAPVASCSGKAQKTKPTSILLSADGAVYLTHLSWSGWGTTSAVGKGVLEQNNCAPTCAAGTFKGFQATVTLSDARSYGHNSEAYSALTMSAPSNPSSYWRQVTYNKGLVP